MKGLDFIITTFLLALGVFGLFHYQAPPSSPTDLTFTATDGSTVDLSKLRGKIVLLDFWATWCPPCREEVPNVVAAYNKYHARGFEVVGISLDQDRTNLDRFTADNGMTWPQYFDGQGWGNSLAQRFGIRYVPQMWLLDRQGRIITKNGRADLDRQIADLLNHP